MKWRAVLLETLRYFIRVCGRLPHRRRHGPGGALFLGIPAWPYVLLIAAVAAIPRIGIKAIVVCLVAFLIGVATDWTAPLLEARHPRLVLHVLVRFGRIAQLIAGVSAARPGQGASASRTPQRTRRPCSRSEEAGKPHRDFDHRRRLGRLPHLRRHGPDGGLNLASSLGPT